MRENNKLVIIGLSLICVAPVNGSVVTYTNKAAWQTAAAPYSTITFLELPNNTLITEQYASLGVHFTDGSDYTYHSSSFPTDGAGLNGAFDSTTLVFDSPVTSIALDFPGEAAFKLFFEGSLIYTSPPFGSGGIGFFGGLISTQPFDMVVMYDPSLDFFADNLYFGVVPCPFTLSLLGLGIGWPKRRRSC